MAKRVLRRAGMIGAAAALVTAAALCFLPLCDCLVIRGADGRAAAAFPLDEGDGAFRITFRHSVSREPWAEYYRKGPGGAIELYRTAFKAFGAGVPTGDEGGTVSFRDGWIVLDGIRRDFPRIASMVLPLTEHRISLGGEDYDLVGLLRGGKKAVLAIEKRSIAAAALARRRNLGLPRWTAPD